MFFKISIVLHIISVFVYFLVYKQYLKIAKTTTNKKLLKDWNKEFKEEEFSDYLFNKGTLIVFGFFPLFNLFFICIYIKNIKELKN